MQPRDIHIKLTDPSGKHAPVINHHRVWDAERFVKHQRAIYENAEKPEDRRTVQVVAKP